MDTTKYWVLTSTITLSEIKWFHKLKLKFEFDQYNQTTILSSSSNRQELLLKMKFGESLQELITVRSGWFLVDKT